MEGRCGFGDGVCDNSKNLSHTKVAAPDGGPLYLCGMHRGHMNRDVPKYQAGYAEAAGFDVTEFSWAPDDRKRMLKEIKKDGLDSRSGRRKSAKRAARGEQHAQSQRDEEHSGSEGGGDDAAATC